MNFTIFDDDFQVDKPKYLNEIKNLEKNVISSEYIGQWQKFVKEHLTDTRNFYLLKTALKIIENLNNKLDFDTAVFSALSFMPDQTFLETTIMIIARFSEYETVFANHFNVDISSILTAKASLKAEKAKQKNLVSKNKSTKKTQANLKEKTKQKQPEKASSKVVEKNLIGSKSKKLVPVEVHLQNLSSKRNKKTD